MIIKILLLLAILFIIYILFFKKKPNQTINNQKQNKKDIKDNSEIMVECSVCGLFISSNDAIIKDGKFFCSKECAKL